MRPGSTIRREAPRRLELPRTERAALATALALALAPASARAQEPPVARLELARTPDAARCPSDASVRAAVSARMGRDPFVETAALTVRVRFDREGRRHRATLLRVDASGASQPRVLVSRRDDCSDLGPALGLAIGLVIDPLARPPEAAPLPPTTPPAPPAPAPVAPEPAPPPPPAAAPSTATSRADEPPNPAASTAEIPQRIATPPRASPPVRLLVGAELAASFGQLPSASLGPALVGSLRVARFALNLGVRYDFGFPYPAQGARVDSSVLAGALSLCGLLPFGGALDAASTRENELELCAVGSVGGLAANATGLDRSTPVSAAVASAGAGVAYARHLGRGVWLRFHVDGVATLLRARQTIDDAGRERELWLAPPLALTAGVGPLLRFF